MEVLRQLGVALSEDALRRTFEIPVANFFSKGVRACNMNAQCMRVHVNVEFACACACAFSEKKISIDRK